MLTKKARKSPRLIRKRRVRKKVFGTADRPRLTIFRSNRYLYVQLVDDEQGRTLASASTLCQKFRDWFPKGGKNVDAARVLGELVGENALALGISSVVLDRNGLLYHGKIKVLADAARQKGLIF
ncbi:MAG: 50S ribosomal protein L18 [Candidatus Binatia bacterium]